MFVHYRTQGFILKKENRGEADQLFTVFTKDFGKLEITAKAIRKISSKLRAGTEVFSLAEIEFIQGKTHKILIDVISINKFSSLKKNLKKSTVAYKIAELFDSLVRGQEKDHRIWQLLVESFGILNTYSLKPKTYRLIYYYFFWNLIFILGYALDFYKCVFCQKKLKSENIYFSSKEGGLVCQGCSKKVNHVRNNISNVVKSIKEVDLDTIKIIRIILKKDWSILSKLKIEKLHLESLAIFSKNWQSFILNNW